MNRVQIVEQLPGLRRYARALTGDAWAADDLVQDTLERACRKWLLWRGGSNLRAWHFTLMHKDEIRRLIGKVEQKGYTLVPLNLHWKDGRAKCEIALAKGKAEHDKRDTIKEREGKREVERVMKSRHR